MIDQRIDIPHDDLLQTWGLKKIHASSKRVLGELTSSRRKWGWIETFVLNFRDGTQERRISIRLPIYGYAYCINFDDIRWAQLSFQYCGQRGCYLAPVFSN